MDEIEKRLKEGAEGCIKSYEAWRKNEKDNVARAALQDAVHELRKIASRLEIELAVSERNEMAQKPIPIPPHRDARGRHQAGPANESDDDFGNSVQERPRPQHQGQRRMATRSSGGNGPQGGPRREAPDNNNGGADE
jgi:hypothetical protein